MAENVVISFSADTEGLKPAIDFFEKIGVLNKGTIEDFKKLQEATKNTANNFANNTSASLTKLNNDIKNIKQTAASAIVLDAAKNIEGTSERFKTLKQRINEAKAETQRLAEQFGSSSAQTIAAQKNLAALTHQLDEFNARTKAFNPENKFIAVSNAFQGIAGTVAVASGALSLFGEQTEATKAITEKLDAALKLTAGLGAITQLKGEFKNLGLALGILIPITQQQAIANTELAASEVAVGEGAIVAAEGTTAVNTAIKISPLGAFLTILSAAAAAYVIFSDNAEKVASSQEKILSTSLKAAENIDKEKVQIESLARVYGETTVTLDQRKNIIGQLNEIAPEYFKNLDAEKSSYEDVSKATERYVKVLQLKNQAEIIAKEISEINAKDLKALADVTTDQTTKAQKFISGLAQKFTGLPLLFDQSARSQINFLNTTKKDAEQLEILTKILDGLNKQISELDKPKESKVPKESGRVKQAKQETVDIQKLRDKEFQQDLENLKLYVAERKTQIAESGDSEAKKAQDLTSLEYAELLLRLQAYKDYGKDVGDVLNQIADFKLKLNKKLEAPVDIHPNADDFKGIKDDLDQAAKDAEDFTKNRNAIYERAGEELLNGMFSINAASTENLIAALEEQKQIQLDHFDELTRANQEQFDNRAISAKEFHATEKKLADQRVATERNAQNQIKELKRKEDIANRLQKLFEITIATARNIAETKNPLLIPYYVALGAVQAGIVLSTPLPKYAKGTLSLGRGTSPAGTDTIPILANEGEAITPTQEARDYHTTLKAIHGRKVPAIALNEFVKNFTVKDMKSPSYVSNTSMEIDYEKLASEIAWAMRSDGRVKVTNWDGLAQVLGSGQDLRRIRN